MIIHTFTCSYQEAYLEAGNHDVNRGSAIALSGEQAYLKSSHSNARDLFGNSVAIDGDTIVVGRVDLGRNCGCGSALGGGHAAARAAA